MANAHGHTVIAGIPHLINAALLDDDRPRYTLVVPTAGISNAQHRVASFRPVDPIKRYGVAEVAVPVAIEPGVPHLVETDIEDDMPTLKP